MKEFIFFLTKQNIKYKLSDNKILEQEWGIFILTLYLDNSIKYMTFFEYYSYDKLVNIYNKVIK